MLSNALRFFPLFLIFSFVTSTYGRDLNQPPINFEEDQEISILIEDPDGGRLFDGLFKVQSSVSILEALALNQLDERGINRDPEEEWVFDAEGARIRQVIYSLTPDREKLNDALFHRSPFEPSVFTLDLVWDFFWVKGPADYFAEIQDIPKFEKGGYRISVVGLLGFWSWGGFYRTDYEENLIGGTHHERMRFQSPCGRSFILERISYQMP